MGEVAGMSEPIWALTGLDTFRCRKIVSVSGWREWMPVSKRGAVNCTSGVLCTAAALSFRALPRMMATGRSGDDSNCCRSRVRPGLLLNGVWMSGCESGISTSLGRESGIFPAGLFRLLARTGSGTFVCESGISEVLFITRPEGFFPAVFHCRPR